MNAKCEDRSILDGKRIQCNAYAIPLDELKQLQHDDATCVPIASYAEVVANTSNSRPLLSTNETNRQLFASPRTYIDGDTSTSRTRKPVLDASTNTDADADFVVYDGDDPPGNVASPANQSTNRRRFAPVCIDVVLLILLALLVYKSGILSYVNSALFKAEPE